ncbi:MAG: AraC family transcriptional regulator [Neptuniibacter sp.]
MTKHINSVSIHFANTITTAAEKKGIEKKHLLYRAGIHEDMLDNSKTRITPDQLSRLFREVWKLSNDEFLCMSKHPCKQGIFLLMARQAVLCNDLKEVYQHIQHFYSLISEAITLEVRVDGSITSFTTALKTPELDPDYTLREFLLLLWHRFPSWLTGRLTPLEHVTFDFPEPKHSREYKIMYPCKVLFDHPTCSIAFKSELLSTPIKQTSDNLIPYLKIAPLQWFKRQTYYQVYTRRVIDIIGQPAIHKDSSMSSVANQLHIAIRTLRRKLADEGTTFQEIKDGVRRDQAIHYLSKNELPISKISSILGFSEPAAFTRAFKQWTGLPPHAYRKN